MVKKDALLRRANIKKKKKKRIKATKIWVTYKLGKTMALSNPELNTRGRRVAAIPKRKHLMIQGKNPYFSQVLNKNTN